MLRLNENGSIHAGLTNERLQIGRQIIAPDRLQLRRIKPSIIEWLAKLPKVLVGVNDSAHDTIDWQDFAVNPCVHKRSNHIGVHLPQSS